MHKLAKNLFQRGNIISMHAPIVRVLSTLDADTAARLRNKFELAYFLSKEGLSFNKMSALCQLEEKHRVDLGSGYKNNQACYVACMAPSACLVHRHPGSARWAWPPSGSNICIFFACMYVCMYGVWWPVSCVIKLLHHGSWVQGTPLAGR